jgi:hypothetical protein
MNGPHELQVRMLWTQLARDVREDSKVRDPGRKRSYREMKMNE